MTSRRVCYLSPAELQKKREIDRDNQRHFRNKRKNLIDRLEKEVAQLKDELVVARSLLDKASQCSHCGMSTETSVIAVDQPALQTSDQSAVSLQDSLEISTSQSCDGFDWDEKAHLPIDLGPGFTVSVTGAEFAPQSLDLNFGDFGSVFRLPDSRDSSNFPGESPPTTSKSRMPWQMLPVHVPPTTRLDHTIENITRMGQEYLEKRSYSNEMSQPTFPTISSLLNPSTEGDESTPLSSAIAAHVWTSPVNSVTGRIAFMYILSHLLRWFICQDEKSYSELPEFLRPTPLQCQVPHPAWIDTVTWPDMRDMIIKKMDWAQFPRYRDLSATSLSVNWKYTDSGAFLESPDGQTLILHPIFKAHIRKVENWSVGSEVGEEFPALARWCGNHVGPSARMP